MRRCAMSLVLPVLGLALLLPVLLPGLVHADEVEQMYGRLASKFHQYKTAGRPGKRTWGDLSAQFLVIHERHPAHHRGADALFSAGLCLKMAFGEEKRWEALSGAVDRFKRLVRHYPSNSLADDALMHVAEIFEGPYNDPHVAYLEYRKVAELYPQGDQAAEADARARKLAPQLAGDRPSVRPGIPAAGKSRNGKIKKNLPGPPQALARVNPAPKGTPRSEPARRLTTLKRVHHLSAPGKTVAILTFSGPVSYSEVNLAAGGGMPRRFFLDLSKTRAARDIPSKQEVRDGLLHRIRVGQHDGDLVRVVFDLDTVENVTVKTMELPLEWKLVVEMTGAAPVVKSPVSIRPESKAPPSNSPAPAVAAVARVPKPPSAPPRKKIVTGAKPGPRPDAARHPAKVAARADTRVAPGPKAALPPANEGAAAQAPRGPRRDDPVKPKPHSVSRTRRGADTDAAPKAPSESIAGAGGRAMVKPGVSTKPRKQGHRVAATRNRGKPSTKRPDAPTSLNEALGLKIRTIVIDPGHGGHDPGAVAGGMQEKILTLRIAKRLRHLIRRRRPDIKVYLTRETDRFVALEQRPKIAKAHGGDLFVSVHINASHAEKLQGVETYFLNLTTDSNSVRVAARENASTEKQVGDLNSILFDLMRDTNIIESSKLAKTLHESLVGHLNSGYKVRDLGVKQAPFMVLVGAEMPSVLVEAGFITNRAERQRMTRDKYLARIAEGIYAGLASYIEKQSVAYSMPRRPLAFNR